MIASERTKRAIMNAAAYICDTLNPILLPLYGEELTPEQLIYRIVMAEHPFPDGKQSEIGNTVRGLEQRLFNLERALSGNPGSSWMRYWDRSGFIVVTTDEEVS